MKKYRKPDSDVIVDVNENSYAAAEKLGWEEVEVKVEVKRGRKPKEPTEDE